MNVTQISIGRFHHFHLARQLEKHNLLKAIYTGYPRFKLRDEGGIPPEKIKTYPWFQVPSLMLGNVAMDKWHWLQRELAWQAVEALDRYVARNIKDKTILVGLSGAGMRAGKVAQEIGGKYICDRGSSHIRFQNEVLKEEYARWKIPFQEIDSRTINKEEAEYELADRITVPSEFVLKSFLTKGVPREKITKVVYAATVDAFAKNGVPYKDKFIVLWVGAVSLRKGFMYLLKAFQQLKHPDKELRVIGAVLPEMTSLLKSTSLEGVNFLGTVPNQKLSEIYSTANVFVLPSLEEGLALVQGEALACGCPIIGSTNSGAEDLITHGKEGFVVPIRSSEAIFQYLQMLLDDSSLRPSMSEAALQRVKQIGGWDAYGANFVALLKSL